MCLFVCRGSYGYKLVLVNLSLFISKMDISDIESNI